MNAEAYEELGQKLQKEYPTPGPSGVSTGEIAWNNVKLWLEGNVPLVPGSALRDFLTNAPIDLVHESFWRSIPFGTGGVRGTVGFGPNRINPTVAALTIQAHCNYLNDLFDSDKGSQLERSVVIANDVREFHDINKTLEFLEHNPYHAATGDPGLKVTSRNLAYLAAGVYTKNGYTVYMLEPGNDSANLTTPELSFLIRRLHAVGGINLSASHNPPDDNGIKVYDENGGQYLPPYDQDLTDRTKDIRHAIHMPFGEAVAEGLVKDIPADALADYMSLYLSRAQKRDLGSQDRTRILFTPLGGCGDRTVKVALERLGYDVHMPEREGPYGTGPDGTHGTFGAIPMRIANPEVPDSTRYSKAAARSFGSGLVLASDPDADRLGVEVYDKGEWRHLTGNQIATILAYYLILDPSGPQLRGAVYETVLTTLAVRQIADSAGCAPVDSDLLVGFKYIGHKVALYQRDHPEATDEELLSFATEESHGYLDTPNIRDKDAMAGALSLARLYEVLSKTGETLVDYLDRIYAEVGEFGDTGRAIVILGSSGFRAIRGVMEDLRHSRPDSVAGIKVERIDDRRDPVHSVHGQKVTDTEWEARNLLTFWFDGGKISFRPSGTEPKLKFYVQTQAAPVGTDAQEFADGTAGRVYQYLLDRLSTVYKPVQLDDAFAWLPDVISLDRKIRIQDQVAKELRSQIASDGFQVERTARWLDIQIAKLVPGESAWKATERAFLAESGRWSPEEAGRVDRVFAYLRNQN
jgi:phosphoglucomutase